MIYLNDLKPGEKGLIIGYKDSRISRRLMEIGLHINKEVCYIRDAPLGDPMNVICGSSYLVLRHKEAELIKIKRISND